MPFFRAVQIRAARCSHKYGWLLLVLLPTSLTACHSPAPETQTLPPKTGTPPEDPSKISLTKINPVDGAEMVSIPAGEFLMGDEDTVKNPRRTVRVSGYWIYKKPVTVGQYKKFCRDTGRKMPDAPSVNPDWSLEDHPIVNVTWDAASAYAHWAGMRLPSEAEWEKAARGTDGRKYPWGNEFDNSKLWCSAKEKRSGTAPVGSFPQGASPYGVLDMAGNVAQWCSDYYEKDYRTNAPADDPKGPPGGTERVQRGSAFESYFDDRDPFRASARDGSGPAWSHPALGFRCASGL